MTMLNRIKNLLKGRLALILAAMLLFASGHISGLYTAPHVQKPVQVAAPQVPPVHVPRPVVQVSGNSFSDIEKLKQKNVTIENHYSGPIQVIMLDTANPAYHRNRAILMEMFEEGE